MGMNLISSPRIIYTQPTAPTDLTEGVLWYNTTAKQLYVSNGTIYTSMEFTKNELSGSAYTSSGNWATELPTPANALDNDDDTDTGQCSNTSPDLDFARWFKFDIGENKIRNFMSMFYNLDVWNGGVVKVEYSPDDSSWTTLTTFGKTIGGGTSNSDLNASELFTTGIMARYFRISVNASPTASRAQVRIYHLFVN